MRGRGEAVVEVLSEPKAAPRRDWSARARTSAARALRYSKFVGVMKRALPVAAFGVIALVLAFFFVQRGPQHVQMAYERMGLIQNDLAMIHPRLSGTDSKGNPFVITADAAIQDAKNFKRARLRNVQADLSLDGKTWVTVAAGLGMVDLGVGTLALEDGLSLYSDNGYELHTARADVDLKKGVMLGSQAVTGHGPLGTLYADSFVVERDAGQLRLNGHVKMTFDSHAGDSRAEGKK